MGYIRTFLGVVLAQLSAEYKVLRYLQKKKSLMSSSKKVRCLRLLAMLLLHKKYRWQTIPSLLENSLTLAWSGNNHYVLVLFFTLMQNSAKFSIFH